MWDSFELGDKGHFGNNASSVIHLGKAFDHFSQNRSSFWVSEGILGGGFRVSKEHKVGVKLKEMLAEDCSHEQILHYIDTVIIRHLNVTQVVEGVSGLRRESYEQGIEDAQAKMRHALGMH